jgi:hypothetical protein
MVVLLTLEQRVHQIQAAVAAGLTQLAEQSLDQLAALASSSLNTQRHQIMYSFSKAHLVGLAQQV